MLSRRLRPAFTKGLALACILMVVLLAGCGGAKSGKDAPAATPKAPDPVTLTYWHTYNTDSTENKTLVETIIPAFQKKYPHITIKSVVQPYDGLHASLVTAVAGGQAPDLMRMDIIWVPEFAKLGALEPLDQYQGFADIKANTFTGPMATNTYKGKHYGLALNTNTQIWVYNPEFLKTAGLAAPPKTMEEFKKYAAAFKGQKEKFAFAPGGTGAWAMLPLFWTMGGKVTNDDYSKATGFLNSDASVAALQAILDMQKDGVFANTHLGGQPGTWDGFKAGTYGAVQEGPWFFAILGNELKGKMTGAPLPAGTAGSISVVGGENVVMFKSAKNKEAAWLFMQYVLTDEAQVAMARTGQMPVTKSASANSVMKEAGYYEAYVQQLSTALPRTPVPAWNKIDKVLGDTFEAVLRGKTAPKAALEAAAKEIDALLAQ